MTAAQQVGQTETAGEVVADAAPNPRPVTHNFTVGAQSPVHRVLANYFDDGLLVDLAIVSSGLGLAVGDVLLVGDGAGVEYVVIELELLFRDRSTRRYRAVAALKPRPDRDV